MATPIQLEEVCGELASLHGWMQMDMQAAVDYCLTDLLPDAPRTNTYSDLEAWIQQIRRGPVTLSGMLEAYRRGRLDGIRLGLEAAAREIVERQELASNCPDGGSEYLRTDHMLADLRALDPEAIAKEAK